jgi:hypothetical protein
MNTDEHDDLWHLLGKARGPAASPFFSRNVLRVIRTEKQDRTGALAWLRRHWQIPALSTCALVIAGVVLLRPADHSDQTTVRLAEQVSQSIDYQVIANLDELLASEENLAWIEK